MAPSSIELPAIDHDRLSSVWGGNCIELMCPLPSPPPRREQTAGPLRDHTGRILGPGERLKSTAELVNEVWDRYMGPWERFNGLSAIARRPRMTHPAPEGPRLQ